MLSDKIKHNRGINMSHLNYNTKNRAGKHLNYEERIKIEALLKAGLKPEEIGKQFPPLLGRLHRYFIPNPLHVGAGEALHRRQLIHRD